MAFSPFRAFRKHQKAVMIMLAIMCMIIFVFSFGEGDLFSRRFGGNHDRGEVVLKIHGDEVYEGDIHQTRDRRRAASLFLYNYLMLEARTEAFLSLVQNEADLQGITGELGLRIRGIMQEYQLLMQFVAPGLRSSDPNQQAMARHQLRQLFFAFPNPQQYHQKRRSLDQLRQAQLNAALKPEQSQAVLDLMRFAQYDLWGSHPLRDMNDYFLGGSGDVEDIIDFMIWKYHADRLDIHLNEPSVIKLVNHVANRNVLKEEDFASDDTVQRFFQVVRDDDRNGVTTPEELLEALTDEFRVLMVKQAYLGTPAGGLTGRDLEAINAAAIQPTPLAFLDYFREHRTTRQISVLELPVKNFLYEVTETPGTKELEDLFEAYKNVEPDPRRRTPGFKEPRRVRLQYVIAKEDAPSYSQRAEAIAEHYHVWGAGAQAFAAAGGPGPWAISLAMPWVVDLRQQANYQQYLEGFDQKIESWVRPFNFDSLHDQSWLRPGPSTMLIGQTIASTVLPIGPPIATTGAAASWVASASVYEESERQLVLNSYLPAVVETASAAAGLKGFGGVGSALTSLPILSRQKVHQPEPLPASQVSWIKRDTLAERLQTLVRAEDFKAAGEEIRKLRSTEDADKRRTELTEVLKKYGLLESLHTMEEALDRHSLPDDPALKAFKEEASWVWNTVEQRDQTFLNPTGVYDPQTTDSVLWWRTEEHRAYVPRSLNNAQGKVEAAWRYMRAQELARKKADAIQKRVQQLKATQAPGVTVQNLREEPRGNVFDLRDVALLVIEETPTPGLTNYSPYTPPKDKIEYPVPGATVKRLASLEEPGDSVVFWDEPHARYYVGVLLAKSVPTLEEFYSVYRKTTDSTDTLWAYHFLPHLQRDFEKKVIEQLRIEANATDDTGRLVINDEMRKRLEDKEVR